MKETKYSSKTTEVRKLKLTYTHRKLAQERALAEDIIYAGTNQMLKVLPFELLKQLTSKAGIVEKTGRISHYKALHQYVDDQVRAFQANFCTGSFGSC